MSSGNLKKIPVTAEQQKKMKEEFVTFISQINLTIFQVKFMLIKKG
jgi:hypothetical protein